MERDDFEGYLKSSGRSESAVKRCILYVSSFEDYLTDSRQDTRLDEATPEDLLEFIKSLDKESKTKSKGYLWAIRYYYNFTENPEMTNLARVLREERIERKPFELKNFRDVNHVYVMTLAQNGIRDIDQMLAAGSTKEDRQVLAERTGIPQARILEFVKLSDLARIPGVKGIRARLYYDAGIDTPEKIAALEPEELRTQVVEYVNKSGFDGVPTLPAEAIYTVEKARALPKIVEY
jgi:hypothetical protein